MHSRLLRSAARRLCPPRTPCFRNLTPRAFSTNALPFQIVDTTLREGEQFATTEFNSVDRVYIATMLDRMGVDYIEMVNPLASEQAVQDCINVAKLGTTAKILTHTRCHMADVKAAVETGIDGVNIYMATSEALRKHSHGKGIEEVISTASKVIEYVKNHGLEVRFSCEDAFRSNLDDILMVYEAIDKLEVNRVGVADTVGVATPSQVTDVIQAVRGVIRPETGIEFHTHNDTGCAIANALMALEAGATHIDTCILGIGERNGITPLGGFLARMYTQDKEHVKSRFKLDLLYHLEKYVAQRANITIPFNNYITGAVAFTHKAGVHSKAVMASPDSYEVINPTDFGVERRIQFAHRLTGWNAMKQRAKELGLDEITDDQIKMATVMIKNLAEVRTIGLEEVDSILVQMTPGAQAQSATFVKWADPSTRPSSTPTKEDLEEIALSLPSALLDSRPQAIVRIKGHLFDKAVINRSMDVLVEQPGVDFSVLELNVAPVDRRPSSVRMKLWGNTAQELNDGIEALRVLTKGLSTVADCSLDVLEQTS